MICPKCGASQLEGTKFCTSCGSELSGADAAQTAVEQPAVAPTQPVAAPTQPVTGTNPPAGYTQPGTAPASQPSNGKVTGAFVCGILSIIFAFIMPIVGIILGIVAIAIGSSAYRETQESRAKTGKTCGIVGLVISILWIVIAIIFSATILAMVASDPTLSSTTGITTPSISSSNSDDDAAIECVQNYLDTNLTFSDSEISDLATEIDTSFSSSTGFGLAETGVSSNQFAKWLVGDLSGTAVVASIDGDYGKVSCTITTRDFDYFMTDFNARVDGLDVTAFSDEASVYTAIGILMKASMDNTPVVSRTVEIDVAKNSGEWEIAYPSTAANDLSKLIYGGMSL